MRAAVLILLLGAGCGQGASHKENVRYLCGEAFVVALEPGEQTASASPVEDFVVHRVRSDRGKVVIYEGNYPQPGGLVIQTGLNWPQKVVVHPDPGSPALAEAIRGRIALGGTRPDYCKPRHLEENSL